jgi:hypothetical protein
MLRLFQTAQFCTNFPAVKHRVREFAYPGLVNLPNAGPRQGKQDVLPSASPHMANDLSTSRTPFSSLPRGVFVRFELY